MDEASLVGNLRRQGFRLQLDPSPDGCVSATITRGMVFRHLWTIRWRAKVGRVEEIWGVYGVIAP